MPDGDRLAPQAVVLRIPAVTQTVLHVSGAQRQPLPDVFALSSGERKLSEAGHRVLVSAWDRAKITVDGALAQRTSPVDVVAFSLRVARVDEVANELAHPELRVVEDRAGAPAEAAPEVREAHAGIGGLDRDPEGHPNRKRVRKEARAALALACNPAA